MSKYLTREARAAQMAAVAAIISKRVTELGMTMSQSEDVIRVRDGSVTILSIYGPNFYGQPRWTVEGDFVPVSTVRRWRSRRSFWRGDHVRAATEALQYIRRLTTFEQVAAERDRAMRVADDRGYRGPNKADVPAPSYGCEAAYAMAAYRAGYRTGDEGADASMEHLMRKEDERLSDNLWDFVIFNSFGPALRAAQVA